MSFQTLFNVIPHPVSRYGAGLMRDPDAAPDPVSSTGQALIGETKINKQSLRFLFFVFIWIPACAGMTLWMLPPIVLAVGISVSPRELTLHGAANKKITGTFTVMNPSRETVIYEVENDSLFPFIITPTTFLLEPNKSATVTIEYYSQTQQPINSKTNISILGRPLTVRATNAASGIKLPVTISTGQVAGVATTRDDPSTAGAVLISIVLIFIGVLIFTREHTPRLIDKSSLKYD